MEKKENIRVIKKQIKIYDADEVKYNGKTMIVIKPYNEDGDFEFLESGRGFVPTTTGILLVIDEKYLLQLHKFKFEYVDGWKPQLTLKDGEKLDEHQISKYEEEMNNMKNQIIQARELEEQEEFAELIAQDKESDTQKFIED